MITYNAQIEATGVQRSRKGGLLSGGTLVIFVLALSVAMPYGIGLAVAAWVIALTGALVGAGFATYHLLKELGGRTPMFGYTPSTAYLAGKKTNKAGTGRKS